ncbi:enterotoxin A family protein, partial [Paraburkholderia azotifigens]|uniref:enterotoxin A family protein n=1 Tax=Paraburkholderia azotifigens TaxID=2057004 RepID=UPI00317FC28C
MSISATSYGNPPGAHYTSPEQQDTSIPDKTSEIQSTQKQKETLRLPDRQDNQRPHGAGSRTKAFAAPESEHAPKTRRQTPEPPPDAPKITFDAYSATADRYEYRGTESRSPELVNTCAGKTTEAMRLIAEGNSPDLLGAVTQMRAALGDPRRRETTTNRIRQLQARNEYGPTTRLNGYVQRPGKTAESGGDLVNDLAHQFGTRHLTNDASGSEDYTFVNVGLLHPGTAHAIVIQRLHPSNDYRNDEYELYDSNYGAFHYRNFADLASALVNLYSNGYRERGGVTGAQTTYYSDSRTYQPLDPSQQRSGLWNTLLSSIGRAGGRPAPAPPSAQLPPPPDFDQPGPSGGLPHTELKRDTHSPNDDRHPFALYRPSTVSPEDLKRQNGFAADDMPVGDVSLDTHDDDVQRGKDNVDGAGFLGTFRGEDTARQKMDAGGKDGYIYYVAPTPNMVDTNG